MNNLNLMRGLFLAAVALAFGIGALQHPLGTLSRAGAGMFPLLVSGLLMLIAVISIVRALLVAPVPTQFQVKNIAVLLGALCAFSLISRFVNMSVGIVAMVFIAAFAGSTYSIARNLKVAAGLVLVALAFQKLLGLNLPLY